MQLSPRFFQGNAPATKRLSCASRRESGGGSQPDGNEVYNFNMNPFFKNFNIFLAPKIHFSKKNFEN